MFSKAYELASKYTHPAIIFVRYYDKKFESGLGSFVILNDEGWILTAAHLLQPFHLYNDHKDKINSYNANVEAIKKNEKLTPKKKRKKISSLNKNDKWIINFGFWWGSDLFTINNFKILAENDLALGKIINYDKKFQLIYPTFKNPKNLKYGTSLCKLGFPFHSVKADFIEEDQSFNLDKSNFPLPRFPIDGIFTRDVFAGKSHDNKFDVKFIETSTPGLKGQSGGPTFDIYGNIWAIQSKTCHLELGFNPKVKNANKEIEENQFLNVGWGAHVDTIIKFLEDNNVKFDMTKE